MRQEAVEQVERLRDHPSIVLWCGNNEVETGWETWGDRQTFRESISPVESERVWQDYVVMFNDILKSVVAAEADPVPYWPSSPSANFETPANNPDNGDFHYWTVWHALAPISGLHPAASALHVGVRIPVVPGDADDRVVRRSPPISPSIPRS